MRTLLYGAIAGACAEAATYPFEVVRRQLQMPSERKEDECTSYLCEVGRARWCSCSLCRINSQHITGKTWILYKVSFSINYTRMGFWFMFYPHIGI